MSSNYSAGQYNDAFSPKRLGNWEISNTNYEQRPHQRSISGKPTEFIVDRSGHLLPGILKSKKTSPWGGLHDYPRTRILCPCSSTRLFKISSELKTTSKKKKFPIPCFYKKMVSEEVLQRPPAARKLIDPYLNYLRDLQLPVVWIVGLPSKSILKFHKDFAKQLANELNYFCIELDEQIVKWLSRQNELPQARKSILKTLDKSIKPDTSRSQRKTTAVDKTENLKPDTRKQETQDDSEPKIKFDTSIPFNTDKLLELLKFAMLENLPSQGFVIAGFPCNMEEAAEFEKQFYPPAVGLYMTSTAHSQDAIVQHKKNGYQNQLQIFRADDPIEKPKHFMRTYPYASKDIQHIGNEYGKTIIRVIDSEEFERDKDMLTFVYQHVKIRLQRHLDRLAGKIVLEDELSSSCITSSSTSSETTLTSSSSESDHNILSDTVINLPPPLISCSGSSVSSRPDITLMGRRTCSSNLKKHIVEVSSDESSKKQLVSNKATIQSRISSRSSSEESKDTEVRTQKKEHSVTTPISRPSRHMKREDIDNHRPLSIPEFVLRNSTPIDSGALGDRPPAMQEDPYACIIDQRLIEEIDDWFESTRAQRTAPRIENPQIEINDRIENENEEHTKYDGDRGDASMNLKSDEEKESKEEDGI